MIKKMLICALVAVLSCNSAWWKSFENNPAQYVATFESDVENAINIASSIATVLIPLLGAEQQPVVRGDFDKAVADVNHALTALNDALAAAREAQSDNPNLHNEIADVENAIAELETVINSLKPSTAKLGASRTATSTLSRIDDFDHALKQVRKYK